MPLLKGTLDVLVLKALSWTPMHAFEITTWIEDRSHGRVAVAEVVLRAQRIRLRADRADLAVGGGDAMVELGGGAPALDRDVVAVATWSAPSSKRRPRTSCTGRPIACSVFSPVSSNEPRPQSTTRPSESQAKQAALGAG